MPFSSFAAPGVVGLMTLIATACSSSSEREPTGESEPAVKATDESAAMAGDSWPEAGVCPLGGTAAPADCVRLGPANGAGMRAAVSAYLASESAQASHSQEDRDGALAALGPATMLVHEGSEQPMVGSYFVYAGPAGQHGSAGLSVRLQSTAAMTEGRRWGYRFDLVRDGEAWRVSSFSRWRAWGGSSPR